MTFHPMGASDAPVVTGDNYDYLTPGNQQVALAWISLSTLRILLRGQSGVVEVPLLHFSDSRGVRVDKAAAISAIFNNQPESVGVALALVRGIILHEIGQKKSGGKARPYNEVALAIPSQLAQALYNSGNPEGCRRDYVDSAKYARVLASSESNTGWCLRAVSLLMDRGRIRPGCRVEAVCSRRADGSVIPATLTSAESAAISRKLTSLSTQSSAGAPRTQTPAEIAIQAGHDRLREETLAGQVAISLLMRTLGIDAESDVADVELVQALGDRGITIDEAYDWLVACDYQIDCFYTEMYAQLDQADQRQERGRAGRMVAIAAMGALGLGVAVAISRGR